MQSININDPEVAIDGSVIIKENLFRKEILDGLKSEYKHLPSKYFYDSRGDKLFQDIMSCDEYYPFNCELEIFTKRTAELAEVMLEGGRFDLIELGAGDCNKSEHLLRHLTEMEADFTYKPIDISANIIEYLSLQLPITIPGLAVEGLNGEYFEMLEQVSQISNNRKVILFLGSNLGNMITEKAEQFCQEVRSHLKAGDIFIVGLDLKKHPQIILAAYNDSSGITKEFNLNLLVRINRELNADFNIAHFEHYPVYDPESGSCKSYLVSLIDHVVMIPSRFGMEEIHFKQNELIYMEISQKYTPSQVSDLAAKSAFKTVVTFFDSKQWFLDAVWEAI